MIKLSVYFIVLFKFKSYIIYYKLILLFTATLILIFMALLTLKQVEKGIQELRDFKSTGYRAFKYNKFIEYLLYMFAILMNFAEFRKNKNEIKEKSKEMMYIAIFPVQKYIAVSITGIQFTPRKEKFITDKQIEEINAELQPGDILLKRNDWQATNLGIEGFWTHTGLYIGSIDEMDEYFNNVKSLGGEKFSHKIREINEEIYKKLLSNRELVVIEAIEEGVSIKELDNIAKVDYFSALRPRISKEKRMNAILKAITFVGSPYDYHFNIESDDAFICTEVIKKSYDQSITFPMSQRLGKKIILPNSIARKYLQERKKKSRELDFVLFYDLNIKSRQAFKNSEKEFSRTYRRNIAYYRKRDMLRYLSTIAVGEIPGFPK